MQEKTGSTQTLGRAVLPVLAVTVLAAGTLAHSAGGCVSLRIESTVRLPDGSLHDAASLKLCDPRTFSPVATMHELFVDGMPQGLFRGRARDNELRYDQPPVVYFERWSDGSLLLYAYTVPGKTFTFGDEDGSKAGLRDPKRNRSDAGRWVALVAERR